MDCATSEQATEAESIALNEIDRLANILSSYDPQSELHRWLTDGKVAKLSRKLVEVSDASERWQSQSNSAFHPGVERQATYLWKEAEQKQTIPAPESLKAEVKFLQQPSWRWNNDRSQVQPTAGVRLSFNAIAKGYIIDQVCEKLADQKDIDGGLLAIGGDMRAWGSVGRLVEIRKPVDDLIGLSNSRVQLADHAIATSSGAFRGVVIGGKKFSHLIDPRTGYPVDQIQSVSVITPRACDADALATTCSVLSIAESLAIIDALPDAACMIVDARISIHTSEKWRH